MFSGYDTNTAGPISCYQDAFETPGMSPAVAASLNRCCKARRRRCGRGRRRSAFPFLQRFQLHLQAQQISKGKLTLQRPNSEKTPAARPVSVHRFLTTPGRVCASEPRRSVRVSPLSLPKPPDEGTHSSWERVELEHRGRANFWVDRLVPHNEQVRSSQDLVR